MNKAQSSYHWNVFHLTRSPITGVVFALGIFLCPVRSDSGDFLPLSGVHAGMKGVGKTVFHGDAIESFDVEIMGVLENIGPKQSLIIGRLSGGPLEHTGVMQGMSGSPVYVGGKLIGAVALGFPYSKDPIAGIRPIEEMVASGAGVRTASSAKALNPGNLVAALPKSEASVGGMIEIATPVSFGGFTRNTLEHFSPQLKALGWEPRQGSAVGGRTTDRMGDPRALHPSSMISVELMSGDLSAGADGTVTYLDGDRIYAFGHRFLGVGPTGLPFTRSEVLALLPNLNTSFKISASKELMGVIFQDRNTAVSGLLGRRADLLPVTIAVNRSGRHLDTYRLRMVNDPFLSPVLLQMAVFSSLDGTERAAGEGSLMVSGAISLEGRQPVPIRSVYSGQGGLPAQASLSAALPLAYLQQAGFSQLKVKGIDLQIDSLEKKQQWQIDDVTLSRREAHPGDTVELVTRLTGEGGTEATRSWRYQVPDGAAPGTLFISVADGPQTSLAELRASFGVNPRTAGQLLDDLGRLRANDRAYVRLWRSDNAFEIAGQDLSDPPPSVAMLLGANSANVKIANSKIGEWELPPCGSLVSGAKTVSLEVRR